MPPGSEPLLAAVCAAPWDDLPRLVFADWLDDHGRRARAEYIRLQCQAARGGPDARACQSRADHLLHRHKWDWLGLQPVPGAWRWGTLLRRGFVDRVRLEAGPGAAATLAAAVAVTPVERVDVFGGDGRTFPAVAGSPLLAALRRLDVWQATDADVVVLASNPAVARLERLMLNGTRVPLTDAAAVALVASPHLGRLRWLRLSLAEVSDGARAILHARFGPNVQANRW